MKFQQYINNDVLISAITQNNSISIEVNKQNCCIGQALLEPSCSSVISQREIAKATEHKVKKKKSLTKLSTLNKKVDDLNLKLNLILENQSKQKIKEKKRHNEILKNQDILKSFLEELVNVNRIKATKEIAKDLNFKYPSVPMKRPAELTDFNNDLQDNHFIDQMVMHFPF